MSLANTYKVVFSGQTLNGKSVSHVATRFANAFRINDKKVLNRLFSGQTITLKRGLSYEQAQHHRDTLEKLGADCCIECESNPLFVIGDIDYDYERKKRQRLELFESGYFNNLSLAPKH